MFPRSDRFIGLKKIVVATIAAIVSTTRKATGLSRLRPTAIFVANDEMAYGAIHALRRLGCDVPGDVSVVGFDDLYLSKAFYPPLTTVSQPRADIGRTAMSLLLNIMSGDDVAAPAIVLPTALNIRGSTAPPRK